MLFIIDWREPLNILHNVKVQVALVKFTINYLNILFYNMTSGGNRDIFFVRRSLWHGFDGGNKESRRSPRSTKRFINNIGQL